MGLTEDLRNAVDDPPPLGFDLDKLMKDHRSRRAPSRAVLGMAGFAAVALMLVGGYAAFGHGSGRGTGFHPAAAPSSPGVKVSPQPSATEPITEDRLDKVLPGLPAIMKIPADGIVGFRFAKGDSQTRDYYNAHWSNDNFNAYINLSSEPMPHGNACAPGSKGELGCQRIENKYGITYVTSDATTTHPATIIGIDAFHPDGTHIMITVIGVSGRELPKGMRAALIAASYNAGLTLHPKSGS